MFENGLELLFIADHNVDELKRRVDEKELFEIIVMKKKEPSQDDLVLNLIPIGIIIDELQIELQEYIGILFIYLDNPCKCHYGGDCVCSDLPQERKLKSKSSEKSNCCGEKSKSSEKSNCCSEKSNCCGGGCKCSSGGCSC